jgi:hypothetical protein
LNTGNNGLNAVLPSAPLLAQVLTLVNNNYNIDVCDGAGGWFDNATGDPSTTTIPPGKGFFFGNPGAGDLVVTLVGEVPQGNTLTVSLTPGLNFVAGIVPQSLSLSAANGFPQVLLMQYQTYNRVTQSYDILVNGGPGDPNWYNNDTGDPADARAEVGLGFFIQNPGSTVNWTRCFNVNTPCP